MGDDKYLLGRPVQTKGGATPPKQNSSPQIGWLPPRQGRLQKQRVVSEFQNVHKKVNFHFYSPSMFVKYLAIKIIVELIEAFFVLSGLLNNVIFLF